MNLQTVVDIPRMPFTLSYRDKGLFVGSCFSQSLASLLADSKAAVTVCPFGEMYNPMSVRTFFDICFGSGKFTAADAVMGPDGLWYSWYHHGSVYASTREDLMESVEGMRMSTADVDYVVMTLGTSWIYGLEDGRVVSNCHRMPAGMFKRRSLDMAEILSCLEHVVDMFPPNVKFILTVSPIRHIKDGLVENSFSKSQLRVAAGLLSSSRENVFYFPSYEIMNDQLRDYRFYADDMLHPSALAVSYITGQFTDRVFDTRSRELFSTVAELRRAVGHRPLHGMNAAYREFVRSTEARIAAAAGKYPDVDFSDIRFPDFL